MKFKTCENILKRVCLLSLMMNLNLAQAVEPVIEKSIAPVEQPVLQPDLLTSAEIQQALTDMKNKMNQRIDAWGEKLTRKDFERIRGKLQLKTTKQLEVCTIFQGVIDETYQLAQKNKHRLKPVDQKLVENRSDFIKALGYTDNIVHTQMGFDCRMK